MLGRYNNTSKGQMTTVSCVPAYLYPLQRLKFSRCTIVPGVKIVRFTGRLQETIRTLSKNLPVQPEFGITHALCVDEEEYLKSLKARLHLEGAKLPDRAFVEPESLAKQSILSLIFAGRISFAFRGAHRLHVTAAGRRKSYQALSYAHGPIYQMSMPMQTALLQGTGTWSQIQPRKVAQIGSKLDRYFRSGIWWSDRLAMAISYFWNALCTPFPEQSFLSLTTALESLLSTQHMEITHILAERCAVLVTAGPSSRLTTYRRVKDLYKIRSKVVHGKVFPKKGTQSWESLFITAKRSNVPISSLESLVDLTISVIMSVFSNQELLKIIQTKKNEQKIGEELDDYFAKSLFRA